MNRGTDRWTYGQKDRETERGESVLGVGSHLSIILWCELWRGRGCCKPPVLTSTLPFCYISLLDSLIWNTFFVDNSFWFFCTWFRIRSPNKLSFVLNVLLPYSSYCFPYLRPVENCLFLLSLKTQQWCMPTQPCSQCLFPNAEQLIGEESQSIALHR